MALRSSSGLEHGARRTFGRWPAWGPALVLVVIGAWGCKSSALPAISAFATAAQKSTRAFAPSFGVASNVCQTRARLDWLFAREQGLGGDSDSFRGWYARHPLGDDPKSTWKAHCEGLTASDVLLAKALSALEAYAVALEAVAKGGQVDPEDLSTLVTDSATLTERLAKNDARTKAVTDTLAGVAGPISKLSATILEDVAHRTLERSLREARPAVTAVLSALVRYNEAVAPSIEDAERLLGDVFDQASVSLRLADEAVKRPKADALSLLRLDATIRQYEKELADIRRTWSDNRLAIEGLAKAHREICDGFEGKKSAVETRRRVVDFARDVRQRVSLVHLVWERRLDQGG